MIRQVETLSRVPIRDVWPSEPGDFTPWLLDNLDALGESLGMDLVPLGREQGIGSFNVDIVAEDASGRGVVIENQLAPSDHPHLGQLVTYASNYDAEAAIWIVTDPRSEHVNAVNWLNQAGLIAFWLVKVEAVSIGDSPPAALFTVIVGPSDQASDLGASKKQQKEQQKEGSELRTRFWEAILEATSRISSRWTSINPGGAQFLRRTAGVPGLGFLYYASNKQSRTELYIDHKDQPDPEAANERTLAFLRERATEIEDRFGGTLEWESLPGKRACRVASPWIPGGFASVTEAGDAWNGEQAVCQELASMMQRFEDALSPAVELLARAPLS